MTNRVLTAVAALAICIGRTFAQPAEDISPPAPASTGPTPIASFLPGRWDTPSNKQMWVTADFQVAWLRGAHLPALVTTSDPGTPRGTAGVLGASGTSTLFGGSVDADHRVGLRLGAGYWFNPEKSLGIEAGFMVIEGQSAPFTATSNSILARPFFDAGTGLAQAVLVAFPGSSDGSINVRANSGNFYEAHVDLTEMAYDVACFRLTSMIGYRFYRYDENIHIRQTINPTDPNFIPGTQIVTNDNFGTRNEFHGIDLGFRSQFFWNSVSLDLLTKLAVGRIYRTYTINGDQTTTVPGAPTAVQTGGVLALSSNSGTFNTRDWKVMPEVGVTLGWQVRSNLSVQLGYSFIFLNGVARAADQIDTTINPNLFPGANTALGGPNRPAANLVRADMWIQSINLGLLFTY